MRSPFFNEARPRAIFGLSFLAATAVLASLPAQDLVKSDVLGGDERYLTHLSTDKPFYRAGERVFLRGVLLHHRSRKPYTGTGLVQVRILGPRGQQVARAQTRLSGGVLGFAWTVPAGAAGGAYTLEASTPQLGFTHGKRRFEVRAYRAPRLKSQIKFLRKGYGPGDAVVAWLTVERAEGGVPVGAQVRITARVDGAEVYRGSGEVDQGGRCQARFSLPAAIARGEGSLAMAISDGGVVETAAKTIPILLKTLDLRIYPEGGELVPGVENRVYFEAFTPAGKPADLAGFVIDQASGAPVCELRSRHEGRGRAVFKPRLGQSYALRLTEPSGIARAFPLPPLEPGAALLRPALDVFPHDQAVVLKVGGPGLTSKLTITLSQREKLLASETVDAARLRSGDLASVSFKELPDEADGVLVATAWKADGRPLSERLVFRRPARSIRLSIEPGSERLIPGGRARVTIKATDEDGRPVKARVGVTVTDDSVLSMVDKRERAPSLPVMALLEGEVRELADAELYFDASDPLAPLAIDLLLGTQGWRRFAFVDPAAFMKAHGEAARRVLAYRMKPRPLPTTAVKGRKRARGRRPGRVPPGAMPPPPSAPKPSEAPAPQPKPMPKADRDQLEDLIRREDAGAKDEAVAGEARRIAQVFLAPVRVYAHKRPKQVEDGARRDFTETLYWCAAIETDAEGKAELAFELNDAVTSFRVRAEAFDARGALGTEDTRLRSLKPFYAEVKLPLELSVGDRVQLPVTLANNSKTLLGGASLELGLGGAAPAPLARDIVIPAGGRIRRLMALAPSRPGDLPVLVRGRAGAFLDAVERSVAVRPLGFPRELGAGGFLDASAPVERVFLVPEDLVAGSLEASVRVMPTPLASMGAALERLIREPHGCFEQTSSTTYPLVMAQQYFQSHAGVDPSLIERSDALLDKGYRRLLSFESPSGGFEWFGRDPGHDALTAYGLLEFTDMAAVRPVDQGMIDRTRAWLLGERDGKGGFRRRTQTLHRWLPEPSVANAYNLWALVSTGQAAGLEAELRWLDENAAGFDNSYALALAANVFAQAGRDEALSAMLDRLAARQAKDGSLSGATMSVVGSGGEALKIEATALAAVAWLSRPEWSEAADSALRYLAGACKAGRFGSTQSTVLALRAIIAHDKARARPKAAGRVQMLIDGRPFGAPVAFAAEASGAIVLPDPRPALSPGQHRIGLRMTEGARMPYVIALRFHTLKPESSPDCSLELAVKLSDTELDEGAVTEVQVSVKSKAEDAVLPTPVAIIGLPAGLEPRHDQLKELVKKGSIAAYEVRGRELLLYWRDIGAGQDRRFPISLVAAIPGSYKGPASRAYLYYTDEHKAWVPPLAVTIKPAR